jgi:hypothetical protein
MAAANFLSVQAVLLVGAGAFLLALRGNVFTRLCAFDHWEKIRFPGTPSFSIYDFICQVITLTFQIPTQR